MTKKLKEFFENYVIEDKKGSHVVCFYVDCNYPDELVLIYEKSINKGFSWTKMVKEFKESCNSVKFVGGEIGYIYLVKPDKKPNVLIRTIGGKKRVKLIDYFFEEVAYNTSCIVVGTSGKKYHANYAKTNMDNSPVDNLTVLNVNKIRDNLISILVDDGTTPISITDIGKKANWEVHTYCKDGSVKGRELCVNELEAVKIYAKELRFGFPAPTIWHNDKRVLGY